VATAVQTPLPPPAEPAADRVPDELAAGTPEPLRSELESLLGPGRVLPRVLDLVRYASDASPYRLIPRAVVTAHDARDVATVLAYGRRSGVPVTLRSGGTSLNGQAQGDGIMVDVRRHFRGFKISDAGARVRVKPGTVLGHPNRALVRYGRRLGPDPASVDFATVGGVIANNSGGMRCGVVHDSYSTLRSLEFALPSGTVIDTGAAGAAERFAAEEPELAEGLAQIREEIRADAELAERIRRKFEIKNTTGYRLCAFLDADEPVEIFRRLLVGSEGTLAFISEAVFDTVPHGRVTTNALLFFPDIDAAAVPVPALVEAGASAVELMVNPTLIAASYSLPGIPERWREIPPEGAVLLVEMRTDDAAELEALERRALDAVSGSELLEEARFTRDPEEIEVFWRVREGMQGIVGALRPQGTAMIIEDVCVRPERIAECARDVQALLGEHEFLTGVAGHASAGNLHFLLTPKLSEPSDRDRYESFMSGLVALIVDKYDGSLKAEHGTGRNMAPYVEREWGSNATELMWRIKRLADPDGVLAPDVLLSRDGAVHLRGLKSTPPIEDVSRANACIECGFCEPVCPSRHLTTTPRQRIVLRREMARQPEGSLVRQALAEQYAYDGEETCAADGSCRIACPVAIDTGKLIKELRIRSHGARAERRALRLAERWTAAERLGRLGLRAGVLAERLVGERAMIAVTAALRRIAGDELVPQWSAALPRAAPGKLPDTARDGAAAVYLPACINRMMGTSRRDGASRWLPEALVEVSKRAGQPVWIPPDAPGHCCATPWASKGFRDGHARMAARLADALWRWSDGGALPVVIDASSCAHGIEADVPEALDDQRRERLATIRVMDAVTWAGEELLPRLEVRERASSATVHPTCSARQLNLAGPLEALALALSDHVFVAIEATCCGMAGDRGLLHPELTAAATADQAREIGERSFAVYLSSNRTCEVALEQATGRPYESVVQLLERVTRP
jgi:D-lactate dehydrogenase